jgi:Domain of unknown function (DUF4153)
MMRLPSFSGLTEGFLTAWRRFPLTMLAATVGTILYITLIEIHNKYDADSIEWISRLATSCLFGLSWLTAISLLADGQGWTDGRKWAAWAVGLLGVAGYYWLLDFDYYSEDMVVPRALGLAVIAHLMVSFAGYVNQRKVADFWTFNNLIFGRIVVGAAFTLLLWVGLSAAILAVSELFNLNIKWDRYSQLFILLAGLFNTSFFLRHVPDEFEYEDKEVNNQAFRIVVKFIFIPLTLLYFVILYAYGAKIAVTWELPKGWVSSLVIGFSMIGVFTWLLNYMIAERLGTIPYKQFAKWFWWSMIPLVALLMVGIGRRISDYGVTIERYIVAHIGMWLLVCALYFLISRRDNIKFVPISLAVFILVALYGPFNMYSVSTRSQLARLEAAVAPYGGWVDGRLTPLTQKVPNEQASEQIRSIVSTIARYNNLPDKRPDWLANAPDSLFNRKYKNHYQMGSDIKSWIGIAYESQHAYDQQYYYHQRAFDTGTLPKGYTRFALMRNDSMSGSFYVEMSGQFLVHQSADKTQVLDRYPLKPLMLQLKERQDQALTPTDIFYLQGTRSQVALSAEFIRFVSSKDTLMMQNINGVIYLKE